MTLKFIWWGLFGFIAIAYIVTGGMDIGVNFLLPVIGKTDEERRLILNATGPTWEGNQVWLITLGAGMFAIWPTAYGTIFSSMYWAFTLVLFVLILRPPGIDYRSKLESKTWRSGWDAALFTSGIVLALSFGVVIGNLFTGLPFQFDNQMRQTYTGNFFTMFSPCALMFAIVSFCMMGFHGALFLQYKLPGALEYKAKRIASFFGWGFILSAIITGIYVALMVPGYKIVQIPDLNTNFVVTQKLVATVPRGWMENYLNYPILLTLPCAALVGTLTALYFSKINRTVFAVFTNAASIIMSAATIGAALFPFIMPSRSVPNHSLTIWDVCSTELTLLWSLVVTLILVPIILLYTTWVYKILRGKVSLEPESY